MELSCGVRFHKLGKKSYEVNSRNAVTSYTFFTYIKTTLKSRCKFLTDLKNRKKMRKEDDNYVICDITKISSQETISGQYFNEKQKHDIK